MQAAVENLPAELDGIASHVKVQFPWGSLLRGVAIGDEVVMRNLRRICLPAARLQVTISLDAARDRFEWERLTLPAISLDYIMSRLSVRYREAGFRIFKAEEVSPSELSELGTSWTRRLEESSSRSFLRILAEAA